MKPSRRKYRVWLTYCKLTGEKCSLSFDAIDHNKPRMSCPNCKLAMDKY